MVFISTVSYVELVFTVTGLNVLQLGDLYVINCTVFFRPFMTRGVLLFKSEREF